MRLVVGYYGNDRLLVVVHGVEGTLAAVLACRHICPQGFYLRLDGIHIDITYHYNGLVIRSVPFLIVRAQSVVSEVVDDCRVANHISLGVLASRVHQRVEGFPHTAVGIRACAPFLADDTALGIYLLGEEEQSASPVVHDEQGGVDDAFARGGHIGEAIDCLIQCRVGVDISAEVHTDGLEIVDDTLAREMLRTVECHVLQEVRETVLVVLLEDSAYGLGDMELATLLGILVVADVVSQSVVQMSYAYCGINGNGRGSLCKAHCAYQAQ